MTATLFLACKIRIIVKKIREVDSRLEIEISDEDLELIMGRRLEANPETFCPHCKEMRVMKVREYWLNHIADITLEGACTNCGQPVSHYLETGIASDSYDQAMAIRELKIEILNDYRARPYKPQQY